MINLDTSLVAVAGAGVSSLGYGIGKAKIYLLRRFLSGFFLAIFAAHDVVTVIQHISGIVVSQGGAVFFTAFIGATLLEKILLIIGAFNLHSTWVKRK